ncbi:MAG: hypothetical protein AB7T49_07220 [Oligoflexales bacterium]
MTNVLVVIVLFAGLASCKSTGGRNHSQMKSDWAPEGDWESLGNGKQRRKWIMEWQCAIRDSEGGKRQDEYCEWQRKEVGKDGNLLCEFNTNFVKNRKYYIPMRYDPALPQSQRDTAWAHTSSNTYLALVKLVRQCSLKNAHCDRDKIAATIASKPECKNDDVAAQYKCLDGKYPRCHQDCFVALPYVAKNCAKTPSPECTALEQSDGRPNSIHACKTSNPDPEALQKCVEQIASTCQESCKVSCDVNRSSDPQVCSDLQRILFDEGGEIQPVTQKVIDKVEGNKVSYAEQLSIQIQATTPGALPQGCAFAVDPVLKEKLVGAGWNDAQLKEYALAEKTFVSCDLTREQTQSVNSCDDIATQLRVGTQVWIVTDE